MMLSKNRRPAIGLAVSAIALGLAGCGSAPTSPAPAPSVVNSPAPASSPAPAAAVPLSAPQPSEKAVAPEKNPPGDIPDTQVFIKYASPSGGYSLDVPEGWARTQQGQGVQFADKYDGEQVTLTKSAAPSTLGSVEQNQVPALKRQGRAVRVVSVKTLKMPHGIPIVCVTYTANSEPNPVTGKQIRQDEATYYFDRPGTQAALTVWAPAGADNVDQWKRISESFQWK